MDVDEQIFNSYTTAEEIDAMAAAYMTKQIERWMVMHMLAPMRRIEKNVIELEFRKQVSKAGDEAKEVIDTLADQLQYGMKGKFSQKAEAVIKEKSKEYDGL